MYPVTELINELAVYEKAAHEVTVSMEHFVESGFGKQPVWWAFVAEADGQVEGFAMYYIRYSTWKGQRMYLEEPARYRKNAGPRDLGKMLFDQLIVEAKEKGFNGIAWQVLNGMNRPLTFTKSIKRILIRSGSIVV